MNKKRLTILLMSLLFCASASAQEWQGAAFRASAGIQWKATPKFSISATYQIRTQPYFRGLDRQSFGGSVRYKITKWLSTGAGYTYMPSYSESGEFKLRNRFSWDITGAVVNGDWKISLKENFQLNNKLYSVNKYQEAKNDINLKNQLKVSYLAFEKIEPYAYIEARLTLNGPKWENNQFNGYKSVYFSRFKPAAGFEWEITAHHGIDLRVMCDFLHSQKIKASPDGKELTSISWNKNIKFSTSVGYTFSF